MNKALLNTDILSEIIKGIDPTVGRNAAAYYQAFGQFTLSAVTVMEIVQGFHRNQSFLMLQAFMARIAAEEVIDFDQSDGALAGRIAGELDRSGQPIGAADSMIAAIALGHGLELVTGVTENSGDRRRRVTNLFRKLARAKGQAALPVHPAAARLLAADRSIGGVTDYDATTPATAVNRAPQRCLSFGPSAPSPTFGNQGIRVCAVALTLSALGDRRERGTMFG